MASRAQVLVAQASREQRESGTPRRSAVAVACDELREPIGGTHETAPFESHVRQLEADELLLDAGDVTERPIEVDGVGRDEPVQPTVVGVDLVALRL
jgi:hypothetical protein